MFNVKSVFKGDDKINELIKPITNDNMLQIASNLKKFADWVIHWQNEYPDYGLLSPTFSALHQTVLATIDIFIYILNEKDGI